MRNTTTVLTFFLLSAATALAQGDVPSTSRVCNSPTDVFCVPAITSLGNLNVPNGGTFGGTVAVDKTLLAGDVATVACVTSTPCTNTGVSAYTDHVAINAAIVAKNAAGGGKVVLGPGDFYLGAVVSVLSNVDLSGQGVGITRLHLKTSTVANVAEAMNARYFAVHDLSIDGGGAQNQAATAAIDRYNSGVHVEGSSEFRIYNIETAFNFFHGIFVAGEITKSSVFSLDHILTHDNGYRGIHAHGRDAAALSEYLVSDIQSHDNARCQAADLNCTSLVNAGNGGVFMAFQNTDRLVLDKIESWNEPYTCISITGSNPGVVGDYLPAQNVVLSNSIAHNCGTVSGSGIGLLNGATNLTLANDISVSNVGAGFSVYGTTLTVTGTPTSGSNVIASVSAVGTVYPGATISGTGIPASTYVAAVGTGSLTISQNASSSPGAVTLTISQGLYDVSINGGQYNQNGTDWHQSGCWLCQWPCDLRHTDTRQCR